jgi:type VI secretion system protein ImpA
MASAPVIDIDQLVAPVSDTLPAGPYWRDDDKLSSELFPRVDTAIGVARSNERKKAESAYFKEDSIERRNYVEPDWREVIDAAQQMLAHSKDLWVAAWLNEALAREFGFPGLRDGLQLIRRLCETYWDSIHPRPDDIDGIRNTTAQLNGDLLAKIIALMPITRDGLTTADYDKSAEMEGLESESDRQSYRALGVIGIHEFEARVRDSGQEFLQDLVADAQAASDEFDALTKFLDERCGHDAPKSSNVKTAFEQTIQLIRDLAGPFLPKPQAESSEGAEGQTVDPTPAGQTAAKPTTWSRDFAFAEISRMADEFAKYEPNSPVSSILRQAVHVGRLNWADMIKSLLPDASDSLKEILKQTGGTLNGRSDDNG